MPITMEQAQQVLQNTLDFYMQKGTPRDQHIQEKPLLSRMRRRKRAIPGGKGRVDLPVVMETVSQLQGFEYDDTVDYGSPAKIRRVSAPWRLYHIGIKVTMHELLHEGITVSDTLTGESKSNVSERELIALANMMEHKIRDMQEGEARGLNDLYWRDGTQSALAFPGVTAWVVDNPAAPTVVGGIDQAANPRWRNRANLSISLGSGPETQAVIRTLDFELPQLRRFGGRPNAGYAGADMIDRLKAELRAKGSYTENGFTGTQDVGAGDIRFNGMPIFYDPTLDDMGMAKRLYVLDESRLMPFHVSGEDGKNHAPARPEDKYVFYQARTHVIGMIADQRNCHGVYAFA